MNRYLSTICIAMTVVCAGCGEPNKDALTDQVNTATDKAHNVQDLLDDAEVQRRSQMDEMTE